jgi:hypothetical protein
MRATIVENTIPTDRLERKKSTRCADLRGWFFRATIFFPAVPHVVEWPPN